MLRNEKSGAQEGVFARSLDAIVPVGAERFDGDTLVVGDVTGDGLLDFVISRAAGAAQTQTRVLATDK